MSRTIEQKVVEMRFDNSNFEKNVSTSMDSLNKLNETINKTASGNSFAELGKAANNLNFSGLTASIQTVTESFSWLEQIAIGALRKIGENIEQHLVEALKKVTLDNIIGGFQRFADMTESTQTILSAIATEDFGDVNKLDYTESLLEKLAWFSDETSYNFTDMTSNIAKFTAAGLSLDESTTAMMGIANWAANAGQNAQTASRAMYQLSQAMGMGTIKLMDWKSIETANMATKEVKDLLIQYGKLHEIIQTDEFGNDFVMYQTAIMKEAKRIDVTSENFRDSLKADWLTADVFADAMAEYASFSEALYAILENDKNKGMKYDTASELIGVFDEAIEKSKETGRSLEDILEKDYRINVMVDDGEGGIKSALEGVTELGIRAMKSAQQARTWAQVVDSITDAASTKWSFIFKSIFGNVEEATELFTNLSEYFYDIFVEPLNSLKSVMSLWKEFGGRSLLFATDDDEETQISVLENLQEAFRVLTNTITNGLAKAFPILGDTEEDAAKKLVAATKKFKEFTKTLIMSEETSEKVANAIGTVLKVFRKVGQIIGSVFGAAKRVLGQLKDTFKEVFKEFSESETAQNVKNFFSKLGDAIITVFNNLKLSEKSLDAFKRIFESVRKVVEAVAEAFGKLGKKLGESGANDKLKEFGEAIGGKFMEVILWLPGKIADLVSKIVDFTTKSEIIPKVGKWFGDAIEFVKGFFDAMIPGEGIVGKISTILDAIKGFINALKETEVYKKASDAISDFFKDTVGFFSEGNAYEKGAEVFDKLRTAAEKLGTTISEFGQSVWNGLKKAVDAIKKFLGIEDKASKNNTGLFGRVHNVLGIGSDIGKKGEGLGIGMVGLRPDAILGVLNDASSGMNIVRDKAEDVEEEGVTLSGAFTNIGESLKGIIEFLSGVLPGIGIGVAGFSLAGSFASIASGIASFGKGFKVLAQAIKNFGQAKKINSIVSVITGVIKSLALLLLAIAGAAYIFDQVKEIDKAAKALDVFAGFLEKLFDKIFLIIAIDKIGFETMTNFGFLSLGSGNSSGAAAIIAALAAFVLLIAISANKLIDAMDKAGSPDKLGQAFGYIESLVDAVSGALIALALASKLSVGGTGLKGVAAALLGAVLAVKLLVKVAIEAGKLSDEDLANFNIGFNLVKKLLLWLGIFSLIAGATGGLKGVGLSLVLVVGAIYLLYLVAKEIGSLNEIEMASFENGVKMVDKLAGVLASMILISTLFSGGKGALAAAAGMLVSVLAIAALAIVVCGLAEYDKDLTGALRVVTDLGLILAIMALAFGGETINAGKVVVVSAALLLISAAIGILAGIVKLISNIPEFGAATVAVMALAGVLGVLGYCFSNDEWFDAGAILKVSASLLVIDVAIGALALIVYAMSQMNLQDGLGGTIVLAALLAGLGYAFSLNAFKPAKIAATSAALLVAAVALGALALVLGLMAGLVEDQGIGNLAAAAAILTIFAAGIALVATTLEPALPTILGIAGAIAILGLAAIEFAAAAQIVVNTIATIAEKADVLEQDLARGIKAICNAIVEASPEIVAAIGALLADIILGIGEFFKNLWEKLGELFPGLTEFFGKIGEFFTNAWEGFKGFWSRIWETVKGIFGTVFEKAKELVTNVWNGLSEKWESIKTKVKEIFEHPLKFFTETIPNAFNKAKEFFGKLWDGLKEKWESLKTKVKEIFENPLKFFTETIPNALEEGKNFISNIWNGIKEKWAAIKDWFRNLFKNAFNIIKNVFTGKGEEGTEGGGEALGQQLIEGIGEGIKKAWEWVKEKVRGVANAVLKFFGIEWEINSPSKAMARMGGYLMEGAAIGIEDGEKEATDAASSAAKSITGAMSSAMSNIDSILSDDNFQPTITPVLDLSQIQNGAYAMGNLLDSYDNYTMRAAVAANYNPYAYQDGTLKVDTKSQMADSIASLENKFDQMLYKLGQIRVVLDSGTLVGELVDPMDEALGRKAVYVGRGM